MVNRRGMENGIQDFMLVVPSEKQIRDGIRQKVNTYFTSHGILPPVSYERLYELAGAILNTYGWNPKYLAFVMVCCGNSIWRRVVGAIPYNRRVLLLPQCLKSSMYCKAGYDQFGLLCENCGRCTISQFIDEAEKLGYLVLVTEGTTVASQLIESGKIDAVIGVGCMEVLQKMYESVTRFAIPGIGIPLLTCGCKDTAVDAEWVREELHNRVKGNPVHLLNLNHIISSTTSIFEENHLRGILGYNGNETEAIALKALLLGGHRFRPFLVALAYNAFCEHPLAEIRDRLAVSVECFHKASLIHDDIEDNDPTRYGKETIHAEHGIPIAINIGDFLIGEGYRLIAEAKLPPDIIGESLKIVAFGHRTLAIGQGNELCSSYCHRIIPPQEMLSVFGQKTAAAFRVSLLLGATAGRADSHSLQVLDRYSHNVGVAYQVMDDIKDYAGTNNDIRHGRFSIILSLLSQKLDDDGSSISNPSKSTNFDALLELVEQHGVIQEAETLLRKYIEQAKHDLSELNNLGLKIALHEILGKIFGDYA